MTVATARASERFVPARGSRGPDGVLLIGDAARLVGVSPSALRLWERQGLVAPGRTRGGERRYGPTEIARLRSIARMRRVEGLNAAAIRRLLAADGTVGDDVDGGGPRPADEPPAAPRSPIPDRLRALRLARGLTLRAAASAAGLSVSFVSAVERGLTGASLSALKRLTSAYGSTLGELLDDGPAGAERLVPADRRRVLDAGHGVRIEDLAQAPSALESQLFVLAPGASSDGYYAHAGEEFMYLLSGSLAVWLDETEYYQLGPGDALTFPSSVSHRFAALGPIETRLIWVNTPPTF
jgi:DNA-binding transcriptional MerR regulator/mannose-6-phosphate isomerase-like protein (cupin superfamily)